MGSCCLGSRGIREFQHPVFCAASGWAAQTALAPRGAARIRFIRYQCGTVFCKPDMYGSVCALLTRNRRRYFAGEQSPRGCTVRSQVVLKRGHHSAGHTRARPAKQQTGASHFDRRCSQKTKIARVPASNSDCTGSGGDAGPDDRPPPKARSAGSESSVAFRMAVLSRAVGVGRATRAEGAASMTHGCSVVWTTFLMTGFSGLPDPGGSCLPPSRRS